MILRKTTLSTLLLMGLSAHAYAEDDTRRVVVLLADEKPALEARALSNPSIQSPLAQLEQAGIELEPLIQVPRARSFSSDYEALKRYNLTNYYVVNSDGDSDPEEIKKKLAGNKLIKEIYIEPKVVSLDDPASDIRVLNNPLNIPDYSDCSQDSKLATCQYYLYENKPRGPFKLGGVNALAAQSYAGNYGENVTLISNEIDHWSYDHVDLPQPTLEHWNNANHRVGSHDTASAGIMFSKRNGFGTTGIAPDARPGYTKFGTAGLVDIAQYLNRGDVIQVGVHVLYSSLGNVTCGSGCYMPVEEFKPTFDAISYLVKEKGISVIIAAGNGSINLDDPYFQGRYNRAVRDSGAIYAGAASPQVGNRASYSNYGSRVDMFSWGWNVTTTSYSETNKSSLYTHSFSGTSSANPILAGSAALLQSIIKQKNGQTPLSPLALRQLMVNSGSKPPLNDPAKPIGVQPDLLKAVKLYEASQGEVTPVNQPPKAVISANALELQPNGNVTLDAGQSSDPDDALDKLSFSWTLTKGSEWVKLSNTSGKTVQLLSTAAPASDSQATVKLTVKDPKGLTSETTVTLTVKAVKPVTDAPVWERSKVYSTPCQKVTYSNKVWYNGWWTQGTVPGSEGEWGVWRPQGAKNMHASCK